MLDALVGYLKETFKYLQEIFAGGLPCALQASSDSLSQNCQSAWADRLEGKGSVSGVFLDNCPVTAGGFSHRWLVIP